jgi:hypothetical protein
MNGAMAFDLPNFTLEEVEVASNSIRGFGVDARAMEEAAQQTCDYLYEELRDASTGERACALVRVYKTHEFAGLEPDLQDFARSIAAEEVAADTRCFTLLGSAGDEPTWRSRRTSKGHRAIPLVSEQMIERLPMINQLMLQLGVEIKAVLNPREHSAIQLSQRAYDVFHVEDARGSEHIPAQEEFVIPYAIRSAVGFGGFLYTGDLYALMLFATVPISAAVARRLRILALPLRVPLLRFLGRDVFVPRTP